MEGLWRKQRHFLQCSRLKR